MIYKVQGRSCKNVLIHVKGYKRRSVKGHSRHVKQCRRRTINVVEGHGCVGAWHCGRENKKEGRMENLGVYIPLSASGREIHRAGK